ncbi:transposase [Luteibacter sp. 329MFSha]|uniref:REP-associated tyrosine transposase n=1 Tax=Luteibacter sp. 329MFSha TaxID=1798239 RepID=UPI0008AF14AF|nr:transposase [Luteibacter sp. 329MFSha]SEW11882.1 REP element-mobilizing transposase RayT [Luteibacter sp. 329MFSha]
MPHRSGTARLRLGRASLPGQVYLVTTAVNRRYPLFACIASARAASRVCHDAATWGDAECLAWVLMPDHWHGLVRLQDQSLSTLMSRFKASSARAVGRGPIWQRGFHERALRSEDSVIKAARYIVGNPLRAGLVSSVNDYPYWNAVWL